MWSVVAADRAAKGNKELAQMQLGLEREKMGQQNQLAQQRLGLQRQGLQQQGQLSREQMKQQRFMQGQQLAQQKLLQGRQFDHEIFLAELNADERENDRILQETLLGSKQRFMKAERQAAQKFQKFMARKEYKRGLEMWKKQKEFQQKQAQLGMLNQFALMKMQIDYARGEQKARREMGLRLKREKENVQKKQRVRNDQVDKYRTSLRAGVPNDLVGHGELADLLQAAGERDWAGEDGKNARQALREKFGAQKISSAIDALRKEADKLSASKADADREWAAVYIHRVAMLREALDDLDMSYVQEPEMSMDVIEKAMQDLNAGSDQRYGELSKAMLGIMKGNITADLPPELLEEVFGPDWDK
jgi:hypothetical protein